MTTQEFNQALIDKFKVKLEFATIEQVQHIIEENDLKERFSISSDDCEIDDYDNVSKCYELEEYKTYIVLAESSECEAMQFAYGYDSAQKIATDFCARALN